MKLPLLILAVLALVSPSCTTTGAILPGEHGDTLVGPTSILGEFLAQDSIVKSGDRMIATGKFSTNNPDRNLTHAIRDYKIFGKAAPILLEAVKGENAIGLKGTKDPNFIPDDPENIPVDPQFIAPELP